MTIKKLTRVIVETKEDGTQITRLPNSQEIMNKINEIIDFCNRLDKEKQSKPVDVRGFEPRKEYDPW
ncbi:hypothetical protein [Bacillus velezensis]|uniref:hypothetical protein n=1 Tax=Bacillus velezensis TaxID=492670 RepID=UPI001E3035E5|nr:hypothetical protein [Bacillus velezensis]